jgi:hypothetical protein
MAYIWNSSLSCHFGQKYPDARPYIAGIFSFFIRGVLSVSDTNMATAEKFDIMYKFIYT